MKPLIVCDPTREYVATLGFLRDHIEIAGNERQARTIADTVSKGCTGSARRFINTVRLLHTVEIDNATTVEYGLLAAEKDDATASAFYSIFQIIYLKSGLDLDIGTALQTGRSLSFDFQGDPQLATQDFAALVRFCQKREGFSLTRPQCAEFASRIAHLGVTGHRPVYTEFKAVYDFLIDLDETRPTSNEAARIAESVIHSGPRAAENFTQAYRFAISKSGLELPAADSLRFAQEMATRALHRE